MVGWGVAMKMEIELVHGASLPDVVNRSLGWVEKGWDLHGGLIATADEVGQWVVRVPGAAEYRMVEAGSLADLRRQVHDLRRDRFELFHWSVTWQGRVYQWMERDPLVGMDDLRVVAHETPPNPLKIVERAMPLVVFPSLLYGSTGFESRQNLSHEN